MPNEVSNTSIPLLMSVVGCSDCQAGYTGEVSKK